VLNTPFELERVQSQERLQKIIEFAKGKDTPCLIVDLAKIRERYRALQKHMPYAKVFYAVKSNPINEVVKTLADLGSCFDVATIYELNQVLALGVSPDRISYGNTIKKVSDIQLFYEKGVRLFVTDSESDLRKLAEYAPGSKIFFRLMTNGEGADWPLSRKFGAHPDSIYKLIILCRRLGLIPIGISFHVGSQQRDIGQWDNAIATCKYLFESCQDIDIELKMMNLGGGFPANYLSPTQDISVYTDEITRFLEEDFPNGIPEIYLEPGRYMVGDAGVISTEVILISKKSPSNLYSWMYVDIGKFGGLIETLDEAIKYPIYTEKTGKEREVILAGPTCDSMDVLYENHKYKLPETVMEGDRLYILTTGAYTQSYSAINFNGLPPLQAYVIDLGD